MARTRLQTPDADTPLRALPAAALRSCLREGYSGADFRADLLAGLTVGVVALPLAMALAIAVGAPPQHGLYTAIVAGFVTALLGGSRTQVTGPTAAFIVILAPLHAKFGMAGLLLSALLGGAVLVAMGCLRMGRLIEFVPHPVTTGFTSGIALVIAGLQLKDLLGLRPTLQPEHFLERMHAFWGARGTWSPPALGIGLITLGLLVLLPRLTRRVPAPLVALPAAALLAALIPGLGAETLADRFGGIPRTPPVFGWPWLAPGPDGAPLPMTLATLRALLPGAMAVAMLGAIESLLSAVVADGMARTRHDPDAELLALGAGNLVAPFFGGIPATGAIARTATNIRSGARSPVAAMVHAATLLAAILALAPWIGLLPMASLAALLLLVAWRMSEVRHFAHILKAAPQSDVAVLLVCFGLTVAFDMVLAVSVGVGLSALLFMRRMAAITRSELLPSGSETEVGPLPEGVVVYDITGPLFFGAAQQALQALGRIEDRTRAVVFRMARVPVIDATGLVALESALASLKAQGCLAVLTGLQAQPRLLLRKAGIREIPGRLLFRRDLRAALRGLEPEA